MAIIVTRETATGSPLSPAQIEMLRAVAHGKSNQEIADERGTSWHTVKHHVDRTMRKLGLHRRELLVIYALKSGLVRLEEIELSREDQ